MAKLIKEFENGIIKTILTFRGEQFILTMPKWDDNGSRKSLENGFDAQFEEGYPNDENLEEITEILGEITYLDEDEIEEALEELSCFE